LPLRQLDATAAVAPNSVSNNNLGGGVQKNFSQTGGSYNKQFNADAIYYHGEHALEMHPLALRSTNGSRSRTDKDPASAILHCALPSRSTLCRPTTAGRARREAICMEQKSRASRPRRCWVRDVYSSLNKEEADGMQQVPTRHRVLLPRPRQITRGMDILGAREQCSTVRCGYPQARIRR
jgi:hypothetical protein